MTDRMTHRAIPGDLCVSRIWARGKFYRLRRVGSVMADGWVETTRAVDGGDERRRTATETIFLCKLRADADLTRCARLVAGAANIEAVTALLRPFRDETAYDEADRRVDGSVVMEVDP